HEHNLSVLLSTSYLDEAERCQHTIVMHQGKILAAGTPADISALANGRTFLLDTPAGQKTSSFQARLLARNDILDAVPEGGRVRVVRRASSDGGALDGNSIPARFEDGFMVLLSGRRGDLETRRLGEGETGRQGDKESTTTPTSQSPSLPISQSSV